MTRALFWKQTFRNLKNNWSIIALIFAFVIIGVSLVAGVISYLFNAYSLAVDATFRTGAFDATIAKNSIRWDDTKANDVMNLTKFEKQEFARVNLDVIDNKNLLSDDQITEVYRYVLEHEGFVQSLLYNDDRPTFIQATDTSNDDKTNSLGDEKPTIRRVIIDWLTNLKEFNGNALARYFYERVPNKINSKWDVRSNSAIQTYVTKQPTIFLDKEIKVILSTYHGDWVKNTLESQASQPMSDPGGKSLFHSDSFYYDLRISYQKYTEALSADIKPLFVTPKSLKNFGLKSGQEVTIINPLMPSDHRLDKYIIAGTAYDTTAMIAFSEDIAAFMPYDYFWNEIQSQEQFSPFNFYISTNKDTYQGFMSRYKDIDQKLSNSGLFEPTDNQPKIQWPSLVETDPPVGYKGVYTFWITSISIVLLVIVATFFLIFFVILFTVNQIIDNNKRTLQFLKSQGFSSSELSLLNITNALLPIVLGLLIGIPGSFVVQNLISFLLESQYPYVLNYWQLSPWMILIYIATCLFILFIFFMTNMLVLSRHNILIARSSLLGKFIKANRARNFVYNHVSKNLKISLALNGANFKKSLITTIVLLVTFSVILFGVGFEESIAYQAKAPQKFYSPYKNYSAIQAPLFTEQTYNANDIDISSILHLSQTPLEIDPIMEASTEYQEASDPLAKEGLIIINSYQSVLDALRNGPYNHYTTSTVIDAWIKSFDDGDGSGGEGNNPFQRALDKLREELETAGIDAPTVLKTLESVSQIYDSYLSLKQQLLSLYDWPVDEDHPENQLYFVAGRFIVPKVLEPSKNSRIGQVMSLNTRILGRVNGNTPPTDIQGIGLIDGDIEQKMGLTNTSDILLNLKISQSLANHLGINKTQLAFAWPTINLAIPMNSENDRYVQVKARVTEIIKSEFVDDRLFYNLENLKSLLANKNKPYNIVNREGSTPEEDFTHDVFEKQFDYFRQTLINSKGNESFYKFANGLYSASKVPNALHYVTLPTNINQGLTINDYANGGKNNNTYITDYKILATTLIDSTRSYIHLINNITIIFIVLTIVVVLLLNYLFLVKNRNNILLFKSLGYSTPQISNFMVWGYLIGSIIGALGAMGISILVVTLLGSAFNTLFNITIAFTFTWGYSLLVVALPVAFSALILASLWIYTYRQDPRALLDAN